MDIRITTTLCFCAAAMIAGHAAAEPRQYCVTCTDPDQRYVCSVETPHSNPNEKGLQLFCIIRTSKDGGHKSCAVDKTNIAQCGGLVRTYSFQAPELSPQMRETAKRFLKDREIDKPDEQPVQRKNSEPETLIDMTGRAVKASRQGLKKTRKSITGTAGAATGKAGKVARGAGKGVTKAARKVGSATKKTGTAVGSTARSAFDCIRSWFKDCWSGQ